MLKKFLVGLAALALVFTSQAPVLAVSDRVAGSDRYGTSLAVAERYFPAADQVFIATGTNFPDALAAGPLAAAKRAPILLVGKELSREQASYLRSLGAPKITILGGTGVVSTKIEQQLMQFGPVGRISGANRYETSLKIAQQFDHADRMFLATGTNFADALAGGAWAAREGAPILLTTRGMEGYAVMASKELRVSSVVILGGPVVVPNTGLNDLPQVTRVYGSNRYETAAKIFQQLPSSTAFLASGVTFPDALSIVPATGTQQMALLLAQPKCSPVVPPVAVTFVGGPGAIAEEATTKCVPPAKPPREAGVAPLAGGKCPSFAPIKGNKNSYIYHMPNGRYYAKTKAEVCFKTEADAKAAGFRRSKL